MSDKVWLRGPSGIGKTTFLKVIAGLQPSNSGDYHWEMLRDGEISAVNNGVLYVPQNVHIFTGTVRYNLTLGTDQTDQELWNVLSLVELKQKIEALPKQLDAELGELTADLSGGERQRIGIARALLVHAPVLLLDEATSSVDKTNAELIEQRILKNTDATIIFTSHVDRDLYRELVDQVIEVQ